MLTGIFLKVVYTIILWILSLLPVFPSIDQEILNVIYQYLNLIIVNGINLLYFFIRPFTFKFCLDIVVFIFVAEPLYNFIMWVLRKIPFLNIK